MGHLKVIIDFAENARDWYTTWKDQLYMTTEDKPKFDVDDHDLGPQKRGSPTAEVGVRMGASAKTGKVGRPRRPPLGLS